MKVYPYEGCEKKLNQENNLTLAVHKKLIKSFS